MPIQCLAQASPSLTLNAIAPSVFDDHIFELTPEAKAELQAELEKPEVKGALAWAHAGRSVSAKQGNSKSVLQESFIFMLRFLAKTKMLPFTGDRTFHGNQLWQYRQRAHPRGEEVLERYWMDKYFRELLVENAVEGPNCLEWGIHYVNRFPTCTQKWSLTYAPGFEMEGRSIRGDIYELHKARKQFDVVMATQVFEHVEFPDEAASSVFKSIKPGGALVFTVPFSAQFHLVPVDFQRFTKMKVVSMFKSAGFCVPEALMAGAGDHIFDAARALGMRKSDFNNEELDIGYQRGYDNISDGAISIFCVAYKPPHAKCTS